MLIKHNIYSSRWDKPTPPLLAWYINEYWGKLEPGEHHDIPLFLVFFNVRYQQSAETGLIQKLWKQKPAGKEQILEQLRQLRRASSGNCPCCLLSELTPIQIEEVRDWFSEYNLVEFEWERIKIIEAIFKENDRPVKSLCWAKLEMELANIVKRYRYQREEMHL